MKKVYETPSVEKIAFMYRDQVVVASQSVPGHEHSCHVHWYNSTDVQTLGCWSPGKFWYDSDPTPPV